MPPVSSSAGGSGSATPMNGPTTPRIIAPRATFSNNNDATTAATLMTPKQSRSSLSPNRIQTRFSGTFSSNIHTPRNNISSQPSSPSPPAYSAAPSRSSAALSATIFQDAHVVFNEFSVVHERPRSPSPMTRSTSVVGSSPRTPSASRVGGVSSGGSPRVATADGSFRGATPNTTRGRTPTVRGVSPAATVRGLNRSVSSLSPHGVETSSPTTLLSARGMRRSAFAVDDDTHTPAMIPRSQLLLALARLRLNFSEVELSSEVTMSASKYGLNRDEFMLLVQNNVSRRMSIERVIRAFLDLQPSGMMDVDELRLFMTSAALRQEGEAYGDADFEPLTAAEFNVFCGQADPRGSGVVHIARLLSCFFPNAPKDIVEGLLEKHSVGATSFHCQRVERETEETSGRSTINLWESAEYGHLMEQHADGMAVAEDILRRRIAAALLLEKHVEEQSTLMAREDTVRQHYLRKEEKERKRLVFQMRMAETVATEAYRRRKINCTKSSFLCWRIADDVVDNIDLDATSSSQGFPSWPSSCPPTPALS
ncbi:Hypothetical protein, putative [Bodo saltans]|uniref:Uncharacterized protein n=1 Tax=Bodo saltans TaxID=75058 RepID=A0A0S4J536_BODSA|nr:Hypothetical protein, putative [Bodo saltans]|eukprot:CUG86341.1 Hypothetical protein, putative [Bodo saltans]